MRKALNENPVVQMVTIGVVGVILAFMLFSTVLKGEEAPPTDPAAATPTAVATDPATGAPVDPAAAVPVAPAGAAPVTPAPAPEAAATGGEAGLKAGEGLPKDVTRAYADDEAIALLVVDPKGIADRQVEDWTQALDSRDGVAVFVVEVRDVAEYSRLTSGVGVSQTPALMVVRPRKLAEGGVPVASVAYGFRSPRSIEQALDDALYDAGPATYYP